MRVLVIGANGTIGKEIVKALSGHEVLQASQNSSPIKVDISDPASIRAMYDRVGKVDAVISAAGKAGGFTPLHELKDENFDFAYRNKMMGQANLIRFGADHVGDGGSFTVTSGVLSHSPMPGTAAVSFVNAGLEGFVRAAALDLPRGLRANVVSPPWVNETLVAYGMDKMGIPGLPAATVAKAYVDAATGKGTGQVIELKA